MRAGTARDLLLHRLADLPRLPGPLLRAAAGYAGTDPALAVALAARADLPADLRAALAADGRVEVRSVFVCRDDVGAAELAGLLAEEGRAAVLIRLAETHAATDPVAAHQLWARFLAKPTKALAAPLVRTAAAANQPRGRRPRAVPPPPAAVLVALLTTLGPTVTGTRALETAVDALGDWLAAGGDHSAAEALAGDPKAPVRVRVRVAGLEHLSAGARRALLSDLWISVVARESARRRNDRSTPLEYRRNSLPKDVDVLTAMLGTDDVPAPVLDHARVLLDRFGGELPTAWTADWSARLDRYPPARSCPGCGPAAGVPAWDPDAGRPTERLLSRHKAPGSELAQQAPPETTSDQPRDDAPDPGDLATLDDYALARRTATLPAGRLAEVLELATDRRSTVLAAALLDRPEIDEPTAVALVAADWCAPAAEVLVRLVGVRIGQPAFALAAAGRAFDRVVRAHGTAVFAAAGAPDPALTGGLELAAAVGRVAAGRPDPGWQQWLERGGLARAGWVADAKRLELAALADRDDTPDAVLLALPWTVVVGVVHSTGYRSWEHAAATRLRRALDEALAAELGSDPARWEAFAGLADGWSASAADLLHIARSTAM